jgi:hypothetical protein
MNGQLNAVATLPMLEVDLKNYPKLPILWPSHVIDLFVLGSCAITILDVKRRCKAIHDLIIHFASFSFSGRVI